MSTVLVVPPANAAGTCGTKGNYFDGFGGYNPNWRYEGVSGYIVVQDTFICTGATGISNFANAWIMIQGSRDYEWAQVGFERTSGYSLRWFSQFSDGENAFDTRYSTFSIISERGVRHKFRVVWSLSCGTVGGACFRAYIDDNNWDSSVFNPYYMNEWGPLPWIPQYTAEMGHRESDVPGNGSNRTDFTGIGAQRVSDNQLELLPCGLTGRNDNSGRWDRDVVTCQAFSVWTSVR